ncbi:MAG: ABC transporter ATP-binding protein/permease [Treponema sp.]|nr:ABC transporter ATP-binding protein/permease [Treponema sp.]
MLNKKLINLLPQAKKHVLITVLLKILALISNTSLIFAVSSVINKKGKDIFAEIIVFLFALIFSCLSNYFAAIQSHNSSKSVKKLLRSKIYQKLLKIGNYYQEKLETAKVIQLTVEGVEQLEVWFGSYLPQFFYSMTAALITFVILAFLNLKMALILFLCIPLIPISIALVQTIAKKLLSKYWIQYENLADNFLENLQGLTTLQIYEADSYKQKQMENQADNFRRVTMKVLSMQLNSIIIMDIIAYGGAALGIIEAITAYRAGNLSLAYSFASILICADFFIPLRRLGSLFHTALNGSTAAKEIFTLLETEEESDGNESFPKENESNFFECINTSYKFKDRIVIKNANIKIPKGSFTVFVGKSGSGKSTMAKILCGINTSYSGSVKIFGKEVSSIQRKALFSNIAYISSRDWIFKGSVKDTLLEGKADASERELFEALEKVNLKDFIMERNGLDTQILENASNLSGGQKQRLSIARALLSSPKVMIFDEATSNVDVESEKIILNLLHSLKGEKTIIMISHRKENCEDSDKIYTFETVKSPVESNCRELAL